MSHDIVDLTRLMRAAVAHSIRHVEAGGIPFVGQVVADDGYASEFGVNLVRETGDLTAHAEIVAMRAALLERGTFDLHGLRLLATGEPCGLCYLFAAEQRISAIYYAVDANTAARWGFDYRAGYAQPPVGRLRTAENVHRLRVEHALDPFTRYHEVSGVTQR
ncbi:nucleoside deaminase [Nocardia sp. alder85J]|uniref:nucleoside deaminase n=1 Tax=Nocardia sp. alder85J TaxID=2862949 RepID=UPI001CD27CEE|nr:nucleoside deaminase [Nocardia sp. alder85J]MCX4096676.1 nucleoside deaminase [Nocardia sp. alder85J]